jgi:hypothetical protein
MHIRDARSQLDNKSNLSKVLPSEYTRRSKFLLQREDRKTEIKRENLRLVKNIGTILKKKKWNQDLILSGRSSACSKKSLNESFRKQQ